MTPVERIKQIPLLVEKGFSQRESCRMLNICRSRLIYRQVKNPEKEMLRSRIRALSLKHPVYGYRRIWAILTRKEGLNVHKSQIYRLWRAEGLSLKRGRKKKKRVGKGELPPPLASYPNHVWTYDFLKVRLVNGQSARILALVDEFTRECLGFHIARSIPAEVVRSFLEQIISEQGRIPEYMRSDNGPEFIEKALNAWLREQGTRPTFITPGSPWENGKCESFNGKFRKEFLDRHMHLTLKGLQIQSEWWRQHYNTERPHSALDYQTPSEFAQAWYNRTKALRAPNKGECCNLSPVRRSRRFLNQEAFHKAFLILQATLA